MIRKWQRPSWNYLLNSFKIVRSAYNLIYLVRTVFYCFVKHRRSFALTVRIDHQEIHYNSLKNIFSTFFIRDRQSDNEFRCTKKSNVSDALEGHFDLLYHVEGGTVRQLCEFRRVQIVRRRDFGKCIRYHNQINTDHSTEWSHGKIGEKFIQLPPLKLDSNDLFSVCSLGVSKAVTIVFHIIGELGPRSYVIFVNTWSGNIPIHHQEYIGRSGSWRYDEFNFYWCRRWLKQT